LLGKLDIEPVKRESSALVYLLVKPKQLILTTKVDLENKANAQVEYISVTEQGYHYYLRSLADSSVDEAVAFNKLSLYSEVELAMNQHVSVKIKPHDFLFFNRN